MSALTTRKDESELDLMILMFIMFRFYFILKTMEKSCLCCCCNLPAVFIYNDKIIKFII